MPKVSVIIPVYNTEPYLCECLDSIINQTLKDVEIICINDGSTDSSLTVLNDYAERDSRVAVISQENKGQSAARNEGFKIATGEYIYFMDSDDVLSLNALEILFNHAVKDKTDIIYFGADVFYETEELKKLHSNYPNYYKRKAAYPLIYSGLDLFNQMMQHGDFKPSPCLQFINADFLRKNSIFFAEGIIHEDNLFSFLCCIQADSVKYLDNELFHRRVRSNSTMTRKESAANVRGYFTCYIEIIKFISSRNLKEKEVQKFLDSLLRDAQHVYNKLSDEEKNMLVWPEYSFENLMFELLMKNKPQRKEQQKGQKKEISYNSEHVSLTSYIALQNELNSIQNSRSYKYGRMITFIPRKIRGGIRCYSEHGLKYTVERLGYKINNVLDKILNNLKKQKLAENIATDKINLDKNSCKISVIIPMYNAEKYIEQTIHSALKQDLREIEILCVDDGSTDKTLEIVKEIAGKAGAGRIKVIHQPNCRAGIARNRGILEASGEYLLFLDADDFLAQNVLQSIYNQAKKQDSDIVLFGADMYQENTKQYKEMPWMLEDRYIPDKDYFCAKDIPGRIMNITSPGPCNKLFRKDFIKKHEITFAHLNNSEDVPFTCYALSLAERISCYEKTALHIRRGHDTNLEASKDQNSLEFYEAFLILKARLIQSGIFETVEQSFVNRALDSCVYQLESMKTEFGKKEVTDLLNVEGLKKLNILGKQGEYFYNQDNYKKIKGLIDVVNTTIPLADKYKISVVVPVYNVEKFLQQCLDSILTQSLKDFELICVDDGSTDNSLNILKEYAAKDSRIKILQQKNRYAGVARNEGIKIAQGECVLFLDSDDFFEETLLEKMYDSYVANQSDVVVCAIDLFDNKTAIYREAPWTLNTDILPDKKTFSRNDIPDDILLFVTGSPWNKLIKRSFLLENNLYFQNTRRTNDLYFIFSALAQAEKISVVKETLLHYRVGMQENLQANNHLNPFDHLAALYKLKYELINKGIYSQIERSYINLALNNSMYTLYSMKHDNQAFNKVKYRADIYDLSEMKIKNKTKDYFKNEHHYKQYRDLFLDDISLVEAK